MKMKFKSLALVLSLFLFLAIEAPNLTHSSSTINWYGYNEGIALGKADEKKIFLHFYADWCHFCKEMEKDTFQNPSVIAYLKENFISIRVDFDREKEISSDYGVRGVPINLFITETGEQIGPIPGYIPSERFLLMLKNITLF